MVGKTTGSYKILKYNWGIFDLKITWYALLTKLHHNLSIIALYYKNIAERRPYKCMGMGLNASMRARVQGFLQRCRILIFALSNK